MRVSALLTLAGLAAVAAPAMSLAQGGTATQAKSQAPAKQDSERLICRRIQDSGSLARRTRQCYTQAQWDRMAERERMNSPTMTSMTGGTNNGN